GTLRNFSRIRPPVRHGRNPSHWHVVEEALRREVQRCGEGDERPRQQRRERRLAKNQLGWAPSRIARLTAGHVWVSLTVCLADRPERTVLARRGPWRSIRFVSLRAATA